MKRVLLPLLLLSFIALPSYAEKKADDTESKQKDEKKGEESADRGKPVKKVDIKARHMPAAVKRGFKREYPNYKIVAVSRQTYADETVLYVITYADKNRAEQDVTFNDDGEEVTTAAEEE